MQMMYFPKLLQFGLLNSENKAQEICKFHTGRGRKVEGKSET